MQVELLELQPSKLYMFLLGFLHVGAACCILLSKIPVVFMVIFILLVGISFGFQFKKHFAIKKIMLDKQKLKSHLVCTSWVVGLRINNRPHIIFFDSMSRHAFRRLRVLLINRGSR